MRLLDWCEEHESLMSWWPITDPQPSSRCLWWGNSDDPTDCRFTRVQLAGPNDLVIPPGEDPGKDGTPAIFYDEDGYCVSCGNGRWKFHMPDCELRDALDSLTGIGEGRWVDRPGDVTGEDES